MLLKILETGLSELSQLIGRGSLSIIVSSIILRTACLAKLSPGKEQMPGGETQGEVENKW